jgi:hypothetical protein
MDSAALRPAAASSPRGALHRSLLLGVALCGLRCDGGGGQTEITVSVAGLTSDLQSMSFDATLAGRGLVAPPPSISPTTDTLKLHVAQSETGVLDLTVAGQDASGCQLAAGESQLDLEGESSYAMTVTLSFDSLNKGCSALVSNSGEGYGRIVDGSGNVLCSFTGASTTSPCQILSTLGSTLELLPLAGAHSYFAGWTSGCTGTGSCSLDVRAAPSKVTAAFVRDRLCNGELCWQQPLPQGNDLYAVFGLATDDVWMAGEAGTVLHWNGIYTEYATTGTTQPLRAVWGTASSDLWAAGGQGVLLHRKDSTWSASSSGTTASLNALWGSSANSVWAVGDGGTILNWNGTTWSAQASATSEALRGVWGTADTVWAVGDHGALLKWNGSSWAPQTSGTTAQLTAVWGTSDQNVWAVGQSGTLLHFDGSSWTATTAPAGPTGGALNLTAVWGSTVRDVWALGQQGTILHYDGSWSVVESGGALTLYGAWGVSGSDVWAVGQGGTMLHNTGVFFASVDQSQASLSLQGLYASAPDSVWAVGQKGEVLRSTGEHFTAPLALTGAGSDYQAVTGRSASDVFLAGTHGTVMHWDGTTLTAVAGPLLAGTFTDNLNAILSVGSGPGNIVAVGENGTIISYNGSSWVRQIPTSAETYNATWGTGISNLWVVGNGGLLRRSQGSGFNLDPQSGTVTTSNLRGVWGSSAAAVWAVGDSGTIVHYDGSRWTVQPSGTSARLYAVSGNSASDVYAVGGSGTILHYDGQSWQPFSAGTTAHDLYAVLALGSGNVLFAGADGIVLNYLKTQ